MPSLNLESGTLYYEVQGQGPSLIVLKGLGHTIRHWLGFDRILAKHFQVITIEHRGIGRSQARLSWRHSIFDLAGDLKLVCDHLKVKQAHILGLSMGGMVALAFACAYPQRCRSLIVANTSIAGLRSPRISARAVLRLARSCLQPDRMLKEFSELLHDPGLGEAKRQRLIEQWKKILEKEHIPVKSVAKHLLAAARFDPQTNLRNLKVSTLILYGPNDQFVPAINSFRLHRLIPKAELVKINDAGHELTTDKPQATLKAIVKFTESH